MTYNSSCDNHPFFLIALAWSHTRCSVDSNDPLSLHSLKHSLSVSSYRFPFFIKRFTSIKTFRHCLVNFLIPFHSSSHLMTTGFSLLYQETTAGRRALFLLLLLLLLLLLTILSFTKLIPIFIIIRSLIKINYQSHYQIHYQLNYQIHQMNI